MSLTHRERIYAAINEPSSVDRPPVALWRHFPVDDQTAGSLSAATIAYQDIFDWDLVKVTPASSFCLKDWGAADVWEGNPEGTRRFTNFVINSPKDWRNLRVLDPQKSKHLSEQLTCLKILREIFSSEIPIIQTIFSPLAQAKNLVGKSNLISHLEKYPESVEYGLKAIAETNRRFIELLQGIGIDGIFYAIQHAQKSELSFDSYMNMAYKYDLISLESSSKLWCNMLHLHGNNIYFNLVDSFISYFQIVNWHDKETSPSLFNGKKDFPGCVCGGINQKSIVFKDQDQVNLEIKDAFNQTNTEHLILGTGCVVPVIAPYGNIMAIRNSVDELS